MHAMLKQIQFFSICSFICYIYSHFPWYVLEQAATANIICKFVNILTFYYQLKVAIGNPEAPYIVKAFKYCQVNVKFTANHI